MVLDRIQGSSKFITKKINDKYDLDAVGPLRLCVIHIVATVVLLHAAGHRSVSKPSQWNGK